MIYLVELLDDYRESSDPREKKDIIDEFLYALWHSRCEYRKINKSFDIKFIDSFEYNYLFEEYKSIKYKIHKSRFLSDNLESVDYIRIAVNNSYAYMFDKEVYYKKDYYKEIATPLKEYNKLTSGKTDLQSCLKYIDDSLLLIDKIKTQSINRKLDIKWSKYKKIINGIIKKCFDNYIPIDEYEEKHGWNDTRELHNEDNYIIGYFIKSIRGSLLNYYKQQKGLKRNKKYIECTECGRLTEQTINNKKYCEECAKEIKMNKDRLRMQEKRNIDKSKASNPLQPLIHLV